MAGEGDLSQEVTPVTTPVDVRGGDEIAALGEIFNDMLEHAQSTIVAYNSMRARTADMGRIAAEIGAGDLSSTVEPLSERDEFGNAFVAMHDYLIGIAEVAAGISDGDLSTTSRPSRPPTSSARPSCGCRPTCPRWPTPLSALRLAT